MGNSLPTGARGRLLAVGVMLIGAAVLWIVVAAPISRWNVDLADQRAAREALAQRMGALSESLPNLERQMAMATPADLPARSTIDGATDALAAATLQELVQNMGRKAGVTLRSVEALPVEQVGQYRRIGLRVALDGNWPTLIHLLQAIEQASPRMLVDDLQLQRGALLVGADATLGTTLAVFGFRDAPA